MRKLILEEAARRGWEMSGEVADALVQVWKASLGEVSETELRRALRAWDREGWPSPAELRQLLQPALQVEDQAGGLHRLDGPPATPAHLERWPEVRNGAKLDDRGHLLQERVMAVEIWWKPLQVELIDDTLVFSLPGKVDKTRARIFTAMIVKGQASMTPDGGHISTLCCPITINTIRARLGVAVAFRSPVWRS